MAADGQPPFEPATNTVPGFLPSLHGFHFANRFPPGPTVKLGPIDIRWFGGIGDASAGLCGGMSATIRDLFEKRLAPPPDSESPPNGSVRFRALVRRQVETLDWLRVPLRFYDLSAFRPNPPIWWSRLLHRRPVGEVTLEREWPRIGADIDAGGLAMVGLIRAASSNPFRLKANHQVLAYGYRVESAGISVALYDPNWPDRDDVEARLTVSRGQVQARSSTGESLLGFFHAPYRPREIRAWSPELT